MLFDLASGSVTGHEHSRSLRNNQDAYACEVHEDLTVVVVADGCSSGVHSEVGANLGVRLLCREILSSRSAHPKYPMLTSMENARQNVLAQLRVLANAMGGSFSQVVNDYFLFTALVGVVTPERTYVFSIGDGMFAVNGTVTHIGPFPNNAPPYMAYGLTGSSLADQRPEALQFIVRATIPTSEVDSLVLGTDGVADIIRLENHPLPGKTELVGGLEQFWKSDRYFSDNPFLVSRRLNQINPAQPILRPHPDGAIERFEGLLPDDTTLAILRRRKGV